MTKYIEAFSWPHSIERFLNEIITERPLLNVCSGKSSFGDVHADKYVECDIKADMQSLPLKNDSFGAVFCDPPWDSSMKKQIAKGMDEFIRVAPVVYLMSPWTWGSSKATLTKAWIRWFPGIVNAIVICRYERNPI
jgi:hypothetical protein